MKTPDSAPLRTLIADDQPDVLEALRLLLKGEGYQTEAVTSPAEVIEALKQRDFDILLMDLNYARDTTSGQEGLDLLSRVQALDDTLPIVVMTAWGSIELTVEAMRRGVRDFILKPWENKRLLNVLRTQIEFGHALRKKERLKAEARVLSNSIQETVDLKFMLKLAAEHIEQALHSRAVAIMTRAPRDNAFVVAAGAGDSIEAFAGMRFDASSPALVQAIAPFDVRQTYMSEDERRRLECLNAAWLVPIRAKGALVGFISLAVKKTGEEYDADEMKFIDAIVAQIGQGINNLRFRGQEHELEEAREIQRGLLPKQIPQIRGFDISAAWLPAYTVSGDYFDVLKFDENKVALCIADVSGKGMPAALLMSNVQAAVKAFAGPQTAPADLCDRVNRVVCSNTADDKFITVCYLLIDRESRKLVYSNAGHNAPILIRKDGTTLRLDRGGAVLGPFPEWAYEQEEVELSPGDRVLLFTDGITEARNDAGEEFGEERLISLLVENRELQATQMQSLVMRAVSGFSGGDFQDDATLIACSVK